MQKVVAMHLKINNYLQAYQIITSYKNLEVFQYFIEKSFETKEHTN